MRGFKISDIFNYFLDGTTARITSEAKMVENCGPNNLKYNGLRIEINALSKEVCIKKIAQRLEEKLKEPVEVFVPPIMGKIRSHNELEQNRMYNNELVQDILGALNKEFPNEEFKIIPSSKRNEIRGDYGKRKLIEESGTEYPLIGWFRRPGYEIRTKALGDTITMFGKRKHCSSVLDLWADEWIQDIYFPHSIFTRRLKPEGKLTHYTIREERFIPQSIKEKLKNLQEKDFLYDIVF